MEAGCRGRAGRTQGGSVLPSRRATSASCPHIYRQRREHFLAFWTMPAFLFPLL
ncbi:hypothetical protein B0H19DRAFT_11963 [Mycena capillaripes]|nr:hypothetical protein B0H19DRAFT_11963 [Mycena capillaripes]